MQLCPWVGFIADWRFWGRLCILWLFVKVCINIDVDRSHWVDTFFKEMINRPEACIPRRKTLLLAHKALTFDKGCIVSLDCGLCLLVGMQFLLRSWWFSTSVLNRFIFCCILGWVRDLDSFLGPRFLSVQVRLAHHHIHLFFSLMLKLRLDVFWQNMELFGQHFASEFSIKLSHFG